MTTMTRQCGICGWYDAHSPQCPQHVSTANKVGGVVALLIVVGILLAVVAILGAGWSS